MKKPPFRVVLLVQDFMACWKMNGGSDSSRPLLYDAESVPH